MEKKFQTNNGFTLAEVLITLGIIGVIAALTIPALLNSTNDSELKNAAKKEYSTLNQAAIQVLQDIGGSFLAVTSSTDNNAIANAFNPYLKTLTTCQDPVNKGICWHQDTSWHYLNGSAIGGGDAFESYYLNPASGAVLLDGTYVRYVVNSNCWLNNCGYILFDVNGSKNPNKVGKDIYGIVLRTDHLEPYGAPGQLYNGTCTSTDTGYGCLNEVILNK